MSAEPILTEAEREGLIEAVQDGTEAAYVEDIVTARESAARREAEDDPKHARMYRALMERAEKAEAQVARVEALAEAWRDQDWSGRDTAAPFARAIENALAEPERDEEGDMLGGAPGFKYRDATVPMDGEQPGPRAKPRLRACVEAWPSCAEGEYNPACCRFPKSCSCDVYDPARVGPDDLEEGGR